MKIPSLVLKQLFNHGSLENTPDGVVFGLKNRLSDAVVTGIREISIDGRKLSIEDVVFTMGDQTFAAADVSADNPIRFPLGKTMTVLSRGDELEIGKHTVALGFDSTPFGKLAFSVKDAIREEKEVRITVPYDKEDDYSADIIGKRQDFVRSFSGADLQHVSRYSFDPPVTKGNIENFIGVAQVPIGLAGPIKVNGEHAQGEFLVPLATTEGTLVASYNRGIKVLNLSGGVTCTVSDDRMQRAPVFVFDSAREARDFRDWVNQHLTEIRQAAEATSSVAKLLDIDIFLANKFAYLRFNYSTGDAAGQNMVGRATFAACSWMLDQLDNGALVLPRVEPRHRQEALADQHHAHPRQAGDRRGGRQARRAGPAHAGRAGEPPLPLADLQRRRLPVGRQQQRRPLAQRHHRDVHRHRAGRGQRLRVVGRHPLHRAELARATSTCRSRSRR